MKNIYIITIIIVFNLSVSFALQNQDHDGKLTIPLVSQKKPLILPSDTEYIGSELCKDCHPMESKHWRNTAHADTFEGVRDQVNSPKGSVCKRCHTTGYGIRSGFLSIQETPHLMGVQCEACHGPAQKHILAVKESPPHHNYECDLCNVKKNCLRCHTRNRSPHFVLDRDLRKMKHKK